MYQGRKPRRVGLLYLVCLCGPEWCWASREGPDNHNWSPWQRWRALSKSKTERRIKEVVVDKIQHRHLILGMIGHRKHPPIPSAAHSMPRSSILITLTVTSIKLLTTADACLLHIGPMHWETDGAALSVIDHSVCVSRLLCAAYLCVNMWQKTRSKLLISCREFTRKTISEYINVNEADTERTEDSGMWEQRRVKDDTCCSDIKVKVMQCEPAWKMCLCMPSGDRVEYSLNLIHTNKTESESAPSRELWGCERRMKKWKQIRSLWTTLANWRQHIL